MKIHSDYFTFTEVRFSEAKGDKPARTYCVGIDGQGRDAGKVTFVASGAAYDKLADAVMRPVVLDALVRPSVFESVNEGQRFASKNLSLEALAVDVRPIQVPAAQPVNGVPSK